MRDGDTLVVSGTPVRLKGLHCPEMSEAGGVQASSAISRMVAGQQVSCELTGERTYDRMVGRCYVAGTDLAPALIRGGFCARCPRYEPLTWYMPAQLEAGRWQGTMPGYC
jgi:endonuclease YncB( thermonuclease family)